MPKLIAELVDAAENDPEGIHDDPGLVGQAQRGDSFVWLAICAEDAVPEIEGSAGEKDILVLLEGRVVHDMIDSGIAYEAAEISDYWIAVYKIIMLTGVIEDLDKIIERKPNGHLHHQRLRVYQLRDADGYERIGNG